MRQRFGETAMNYKQPVLFITIICVRGKDSRGHSDDVFQDLILTVHHCYMHLLMNTPAFKVIENHMGIGFCKNQTMNPAAKPNQPQADLESI